MIRCMLLEELEQHPTKVLPNRFVWVSEPPQEVSTLQHQQPPSPNEERQANGSFNHPCVGAPPN